MNDLKSAYQAMKRIMDAAFSQDMLQAVLKDGAVGREVELLARKTCPSRSAQGGIVVGKRHDAIFDDVLRGIPDPAHPKKLPCWVRRAHNFSSGRLRLRTAMRVRNSCCVGSTLRTA